MNYERIYNQLIEKRRKNPLTKKDGYCEKHHIVPRFLNGSNDESNLINFTAREHFVAHLLLTQIYKRRYGNPSTEYYQALSTVTYFKTFRATHTGRKELVISGRLYEKIRKELATNRSFYLKKTEKRKGKNNGMYGKHRTDEEKRKIAQTRKERGCGIGEKNPMYGKACTYKMTEEERKKHYQKVSKTMTGKRGMYHKETRKNTWVNPEDVQEYLDKGYVFGCLMPSTRKSIKGYKRVKYPNEKGYKQIPPEKVQEFLNMGYYLVSKRKV